MTTWHPITATTERGAKIMAGKLVEEKEGVWRRNNGSWVAYGFWWTFPVDVGWIVMRPNGAEAWQACWTASLATLDTSIYSAAREPLGTTEALGAAEDTWEGPGFPDTAIATFLAYIGPGTGRATPEDTARCLVEWLATDGWMVVRS